MTKGKAISIFKNIHEEAEDPEEKLLAIQDVLSLETHNSVTKQDLIEVLRWLTEEYI